jgi:hypothetical protein
VTRLSGLWKRNLLQVAYLRHPQRISKVMQRGGEAVGIVAGRIRSESFGDYRRVLQESRPPDQADAFQGTCRGVHTRLVRR